MVRTELREHIFKMLFQIEFNTLEEMPKHLELYFEIGRASCRERVCKQV